MPKLHGSKSCWNFKVDEAKRALALELQKQATLAKKNQLQQQISAHLKKAQFFKKRPQYSVATQLVKGPYDSRDAVENSMNFRSMSNH